MTNPLSAPMTTARLRARLTVTRSLSRARCYSDFGVPGQRWCRLRTAGVQAKTLGACRSRVTPGKPAPARRVGRPAGQVRVAPLPPCK